MVIQRIDFNLQVRIVIEKSTVAETGAFKFFSHEHDLVLFLSDLHLEVFDIGRNFNVSARFRVDSLLKVSIFVSVFLF